jgi:hypothetical protein
MTRNFYTSSLVAALTSSFALLAQGAKADEVITTVKEVPAVVTTTQTTTRDSLSAFTAGPSILVTNSLGRQLMTPSRMSPNQILFVTTGAAITGFTCCAPDDLITRRDDLVARILSEKASGSLSSEQSVALLSSVQNAFEERQNLSPGSESDVDHVKGVKRIYRQFDRISNDIMKDSKQGNKQLAGNYSYVAL